MRFFSDADVELWHTRCGAYQLPFFCRPVTLDGGLPAWHLKQAVSANPALTRKAKAELDACAVFIAVDGHILNDVVFRAQFTKADGITPMFYYRREGEPVREPVALDVDEAFYPYKEAPKSNKSFVESLHRTTRIDDLSVLKTLWNAICNHMAYWLIVEQRSIDFGWFKLHAFPVRANWKQIVVARYPEVKAAARMAGESRDDLLGAAGVISGLQQTDIIALRGERHERTVGWTVEVEPTQHWDDYADAAERDRVREATSGDEYVSLWGRTMFRLRDSILTCLCRFASQSALPAATVGKGGSGHRGGFVDYLRADGVRPVDVDDASVSVTGGGGEDAVRTPTGNVAGLTKARRVPKVQRIQLAPPDMRNTRRDG